MGRAARRKQIPPAAAPGAAPAARRAAAAAPAGLPPWLHAVAGPLLIVAVGWAIYANSFAIPFIFDDYFEIEANPTVQALQPLGSYLTRSRGLTVLSFALNVRQGGSEVWGFHLVNLLVHLANALLVYALVRRTLVLPGFADRYAPRARALATLVALIFVAHPLQTMATSYIVQRAESLASFFYLATLLCAAAAFTAADGARRAGLAALALLAAVLGVVSKEIVATVPVAVALYWFCFLRGERRGAPGRRLLLLALLALPVVYGLFLARDYLLPAALPDGDAGRPRAWMFIPTAGFQVEGIGPWQYLVTQFGVIIWYLRLFVVPAGQVFDYGWPFADSLWRADVLLPGAALLALAAAAVAAYRRYPLATFCLGWVFVTLAPSSSIVPLRDAAFEHRMYLPIVGLAWLLIVGGHDLLGWPAGRQGAAPRRWRRLGAGAAALWIAALGLATIARNAVLADPLALAEDNAAKAPEHWRAQYALGDALLRQRRTDEAMVAYEAAVRLNPEQGATRVTLGNLYLQRKRYDDAERVLEPVMGMMEESVVAAAAQNLASVYQSRGDLERAEGALRRAVELKPQWNTVRRQLAAVLARRGDWLAAAREYDEVLRADPRQRARLAAAAARASYEAGRQLDRAGRPVVAERRLATALDLDPRLLRARQYLAYVQARSGAYRRAVATLEQAAREQPGDAWTADSLARARQRQPLAPPPS